MPAQAKHDSFRRKPSGQPSHSNRLRTGDEIELNVPERRIDLRVEENAIKRRIEAAPPRPPRYRRGYGKLFLEQVTQAHEGCDFRFLRKDA